jgi:uncharacterized membrane protein YdcZ (DUF606 family)
MLSYKPDCRNAAGSSTPAACITFTACRGILGGLAAIFVVPGIVGAQTVGIAVTILLALAGGVLAGFVLRSTGTKGEPVMKWVPKSKAVAYLFRLQPDSSCIREIM